MHRISMYALFAVIATKKHALTSSAKNKKEREANCPERRLCQMLVVCYTNHALDQFLEGILNFCPIDGIMPVMNMCAFCVVIGETSSLCFLYVCESIFLSSPLQQNGFEVVYKLLHKMESEDECYQKSDKINKLQFFVDFCKPLVLSEYSS